MSSKKIARARRVNTERQWRTNFVPMLKVCRVFRQQDENYCATCGERWDASEEKPACPKNLH